MSECARCGRPAARGVLCERCAQPLAVEKMLPEHVTTRRAAERGAGAWLIDGFGVPHRLAPSRTVVGRRSDADLAVHNTSVSRDHAELRRAADGWQVRDLGSRNGTFVDDLKVDGRVMVANLASLRFGDVPFVLVESSKDLAVGGAASVETSHGDGGARQYDLVHDQLELCVLAASSDDEAGGVLLHRRRGAPAWAELDLPGLEHQLLLSLCEQAVASERSPSASRGAVPTKTLVKRLAFKTRFANEENVRQVVKRLRVSLAAIGADDILETVPGRGYYLRCKVSTRSR